MDMLIFVYNIILLVLFTVVTSYSFKAYLYKKEKLHFYISILFMFYIFDNVVIYMTEFLDKFSSAYDLSFLIAPTFKTIIFIVTGLCLILIQENVLKLKVKPFDICIYLILVSAVLIVPFIFKKNLMVWLYYLPYQLFTFYLSYIGILYLNKNTNLINNKFIKNYRTLLILTAVFSILIVIEDSIVIFNFDIYSDVLVKINNRNLCEDILSIIYALFGIKYYSHLMTLSPNEYNKPQENPNIVIDDNLIKKESIRQKALYADFAETYNLTPREIEILNLLLQDKTNKDISEELTISLGTVKTHVHNIYQKVDVTKRHMLIKIYKEFCEDIKKGNDVEIIYF
ncbi:HTH-type transcriptional regulator MalT [Terrisporobacter vanillatitrophus]